MERSEGNQECSIAEDAHQDDKSATAGFITVIRAVISRASRQDEDSTLGGAASGDAYARKPATMIRQTEIHCPTETMALAASLSYPKDRTIVGA
jgi:hypothetical protein